MGHTVVSNNKVLYQLGWTFSSDESFTWVPLAVNCLLFESAKVWVVGSSPLHIEPGVHFAFLILGWLEDRKSRQYKCHPFYHEK